MTRKVLILLTLFVFGAFPVEAQTTAFTYQGKINDGAGTAESYDFEFKLYQAQLGGVPLGTQIRLGVAVSGGAFTVQLDFGAQFDGPARFLEIGVKPAGSNGAFTTLTPRQQITSVPYSVRSLTSTDTERLGGVAANQFVQTSDSRLTNDRNPLPGSINYIQNTPNFQQFAEFDIGGSGRIRGDLTVDGILTAQLPATSPNYVQNRTTQQSLTNFNISGTGIAMQFNAPAFFGTNFTGANFFGNNFNATSDFRINGSRVFATPDTRNTFAGLQTGTVNTAADNAFFGFNAGHANTTGSNNSFFGSDAGGSNTIGGSNSFFGSDTGDSNTLGAGNSFFGRSAGHSNTNGGDNTFVGSFAGEASTTASGNTFVGHRAGSTTNRDFNTFVGALAGANNTSGAGNAFFGGSSGYNNTTGTANIFVGIDAGVSNTTGFNNTVIGESADVGSGNLSYATAVGAGAMVSNSNSIVLGRADGSDAVRIPGAVIIDGSLVVHTLGSAGSTQLCLNAADRLAPCSSSLRYKTNTQSFLGGLDIVRRLTPISFTWKEGGMDDIGFAAEEVEKIEPRLTIRNQKGEIEGVKYGQLTTVLVNAVKEQQAKIESQQRQNSLLQEQIYTQNRQYEQQQKQIQQLHQLLHGLRILICQQNPTAEICKENK